MTITLNEKNSNCTFQIQVLFHHCKLFSVHTANCFVDHVDDYAIYAFSKIHIHLRYCSTFRRNYVIVISLSTVEYTSVSRVYSTVDSDITNLIHGLVDCLERRLVVDG